MLQFECTSLPSKSCCIFYLIQPIFLTGHDESKAEGVERFCLSDHFVLLIVVANPELSFAMSLVISGRSPRP